MFSFGKMSHARFAQDAKAQKKDFAFLCVLCAFA